MNFIVECVRIDFDAEYEEMDREFRCTAADIAEAIDKAKAANSKHNVFKVYQLVRIAEVV